MKTTLDISDHLLERAKRRARERGKPLRALVEEGLRLVLDGDYGQARYTLPDRSVGDASHENPLEVLSWQDLRDLIYGGALNLLAVETNVLVYAHRREASEHPVARDLLRGLAEGHDTWAIPWPCVYEFFSVVTNARIWRDAASTPEQAWSQIQAWSGSPSLRLIGETDGLLAMLGPLVNRPRVRGAAVHDARIAAICLAHGVEALITRDRDFSLFPELRVRNPFAPASRA